MSYEEEYLLKEAEGEEVQDVFKILGQDGCIEILRILNDSQNSLTVSEIQEELEVDLEVSDATVYRRIDDLKEVNLVEENTRINPSTKPKATYATVKAELELQMDYDSLTIYGSTE